MFIYVCLVTSNYPFRINPNMVGILLSASVLGAYVLSLQPVALAFLGSET